VLRLAELAARECDGKDAFWVPVLVAAKRQRRPEIKMREIGSSVGTCRRLRLDDGLLFPNPVKEGLPTIHPESWDRTTKAGSPLISGRPC
jgi:hypothetical protein